MDNKSVDILGIAPYGDVLKITTEGVIKLVSNFLNITCRPLLEELTLYVKDNIKIWRLKNLFNTISKAEGKIDYLNGEIVMVNPRIGYLIAENASIVEDDELQDMWAGLFASSASSDGKDDSNIVFINILKQLTMFQANVLKYTFNNSRKVRLNNGLIVGSELCKSINEVYDLFQTRDINKIDRELDSLRSLGLIINGICFDSLIADLSLTSLGIHFVSKCMALDINALSLITESEAQQQGLILPQTFESISYS